MKTGSATKKFDAALELLSDKSTTIEKAQSVITLLESIDKRLDKKLKTFSKSLSDLQKLQEGEYIDLAAENLPENTEAEKKRKKAILLFIKNWKSLQSEVEKVQGNIETKEELNAKSVSQILTKAKGPYGLITLAALAIVVGGMFFAQNKISTETKDITKASNSIQSSAKTLKYIAYQDKKIPLTEVKAVTGTECDREAHYHPQNPQGATASNGELVRDPNPSSCGFGKISEIKILEE